MRPFSPRTLPLLLSFAAVAFAAQSPLLMQEQAAFPSFPPTPASNTLPSLADVLTTTRKLSIWYDYARDVEKVTERLSSSIQQTTLLVPLNSAILSLPRKPHESVPTTPSLPDSLSILQQDALTANNVNRFISAHVVPETIDLSSSSSELTFSTLLADHKLTFTPGDDGKWTVGNGLNVVEVLEASNGKVLILDGVVEFA
ncbi:hypothetical protein BDY24DRAFT_387175 [Mrakia frigida]|uniref:uncharacterized protein n=1 Tax=Mrakia frigida TaxID=29902 RepID=UPI003FCC2658